MSPSDLAFTDDTRPAISKIKNKDIRCKLTRHIIFTPNSISSHLSLAGVCDPSHPAPTPPPAGTDPSSLLFVHISSQRL